MKRVLLSLGVVSLAWLVGCAAPQVESVDTGDARPAPVERPRDEGPRKLDVKPGTLRMRAPAPAAAMRPRLDSDQDAEANDADDASTMQVIPERAMDDAVYRLKSGDPVVITLRGIPGPFSVEDVVDENGQITLPYINSVQAVGKTSSELEEEIHGRYVPDFYRYCSVNVLVPTQRSYFVRGAVRQPGQRPFTAGITLLQAIVSAGGYNDFAHPKKVRILRGGETTTYNMLDIEKDPATDVRVEPGDVIVVPERIW